MIDHEQVEPERLKEAPWAATYTLLPDLKTLASSLGEYGQLTPVLAQKSTGYIIDGSQRVRLISGNKGIAEKVGGMVWVSWIDCSDIDAMVLHVQMNRGRGQIVARKLSKIVRMLEKAAGFSKSDFDRLFTMKFDELDLMLDGSILKHRKISNHSYSRAWVPVEAPPGTVDKVSMVIETPPNADR